MAPTIYVITYHEFNHGKMKPGNSLSPKFLHSDKNYIFYLIDKVVPPELKSSQTILEYELDPVLHEAGGKYFGEWSFLLAEEKHSFCQYPFFMISSRFYEKNHWLKADLNTEWDQLFSLLNEYGWGYLPSYDRPIRWVDLSWEKAARTKAWEYTFFPFTKDTYQLIKDIFKIDISKNHQSADLFCNYIGFRSRNELLEYVEYYRPLINHFFNHNYCLKTEISPYVCSLGSFRNEKPFTFLLEFLSHLFFFQKQKKYFALHYDGYYSINEANQELGCLDSFLIPWKTSLKRLIQWQIKKLTSESRLAKIKTKLKKQERIYKAIKTIIRKCFF